MCETDSKTLFNQAFEPILESSSQLNQGFEPIPESSSSLLIKPESSSQTDNPSCGLSIAAGLSDKTEQSNSDPYKSAQNVELLIEAWITDPTTFANDLVPMVVKEKIKWNRWVLPWRTGDRRLNNQYQNFNPIVVDLIALELANASSCSSAQKITHAIAVMNTWEKTKGGWTNLMQRYQQAISTKQRDNAPTPTKQTPNQKANISLAQAIAEDEKRRQQEQSKQTNSALPQHTSSSIELKEKLLSLAGQKKVRPPSRLSPAALLEVEAQLKKESEARILST